MIRNRRNTLSLYRMTKVQTGVPSTEALVRTFEGRIDPSATTTGFNDGKQTTITSPVLFVDIDESFESGDLIADTNGQRYVVANGEQPNGVSGIEPLLFRQHKEIILEKANS